jgi:biotin carboxylase
LKRNLLIIGAGPNQLPAIRMAKERGYMVLATDMDPKAEGFSLADEAGHASTRDVAETIAFARRAHQQNPIDGVMTMASESAVTVARVAEALGLTGLAPEAAENATNKVKRQLIFKKKCVASPDFCFARTFTEACQKANELGWPVVVKPADSAGSRGVQKVENPQEMEKALKEIRTISTVPEFLMEEFLTGTEHSIEGIVIEGKIFWVGLSDRNYDNKHIYPPYFLEDGDTMPTALDAKTVKAIQKAATQAVFALGIDWGPVKGDIIIDHKKGIQVLEMAARLSGDYFCYETIPLHNGINLLEALMDLSLGLPVDPESLKPRYNRGVALRYVWPKPGRVISIEGIEAARAMPGVHFVNFEPRWKDIGIGSVIPPAKSMGERVASVMAHGETREEAVRIAEQAVSRIVIRTESVQDSKSR